MIDEIVSPVSSRNDSNNQQRLNMWALCIGEIAGICRHECAGGADTRILSGHSAIWQNCVHEMLARKQFLSRLVKNATHRYDLFLLSQ